MNRRTLSMDGRSHPGAVDCWPPIQSSLSLLTASLRGPGTILVQHKQKQKFFFFPLALPFFYSTVNKNRFFFPPPTPALIGPPQQSACNAFLGLFLGIICRRVKLNLRLLRFTTGWFTRWGYYSVPWVIGLRCTKLHRELEKNEVTSKSKTL